MCLHMDDMSSSTKEKLWLMQLWLILLGKGALDLICLNLNSLLVNRNSDNYSPGAVTGVYLTQEK